MGRFNYVGRPAFAVAVIAGAAIAAYATGAAMRRAAAATTETEPLRVCSGPNSLPFSNRSDGSFENSVAMLIAHALRHRPPLGS